MHNSRALRNPETQGRHREQSTPNAAVGAVAAARAQVTATAAWVLLSLVGAMRARTPPAAAGASARYVMAPLPSRPRLGRAAHVVAAALHRRAKRQSRRVPSQLPSSLHRPRPQPPSPRAPSHLCLTSSRRHCPRCKASRCALYFSVPCLHLASFSFLRAAHRGDLCLLGCLCFALGPYGLQCASTV